ncbi:hypothetical protein N7541_009502 [Penicillium brevicompactum]|uniref:Subtelomeric hrmA-associated cluster protein AFUB-079030/YDR124W-like helical bundle domain-containing protein n=1 Tax=Penicillium brevicompactum TaxID=5074 RepID=A0A9W9QLZ7_PENBR|nr:hypothetical protein N7541_009502 [Penicillium brevicompactum]
MISFFAEQHHVPPPPLATQPNTQWMRTHQTTSAELIQSEWQFPHGRLKQCDPKRTDMVRSLNQSTSHGPTPGWGAQFSESATGTYYDNTMKRHLKFYIKLVEPRKQINYPYNGRRVVSGVSQHLDPELTKTGWWPIGTRHREPDHLLKPGQQNLFEC